MYKIKKHYQSSIEFALHEKLTESEIVQMVHQVGSICVTHQCAQVLLDASELSQFHVRFFLEEFNFYEKYCKHINRLAIVSDMDFDIEIWGIFRNLRDARLKLFTADEIEMARNWIFSAQGSQGEPTDREMIAVCS